MKITQAKVKVLINFTTVKGLNLLNRILPVTAESDTHVEVRVVDQSLIP